MKENTNENELAFSRYDMEMFIRFLDENYDNTLKDPWCRKSDGKLIYNSSEIVSDFVSNNKQIFKK